MKHDSTNGRPTACVEACAADEIWEAIGHMEQIIAAQQQQIDRYEHRMALLTSREANQQMVLERLQSDVGGLLASAQMRPHLIGGRLPALAELTQLKAQIFHTPDLSPSERKGKTVWSLRLTVWINGLRAAEEIKGVQLYPSQEFARKVAGLGGDIPDLTNELAAYLADGDREDVLAGMLRAKTKRKGTPYIADQFCILRDYLTDAPQVIVSIGGDDVGISNFRPAAGSKAGHAKWWGEWVR